MRPSVTANSETSGPSRYSSTSTWSHEAACRSATSRSSVTTTPLPAASPSSLTTYGGPNSSRADSTSSEWTQTRAWAVGTPAAAITSLANALEPSSRAASRLGPKTAMPRETSSSVTPATSGASGPTTTRFTPSRSARSATSVPISGLISCRVATAVIPGLPGAACTATTPGSAASARARACSRPPVPITRQVRGGVARGVLTGLDPTVRLGTVHAQTGSPSQTRSWRTIEASRDGPTPTTEIRAPDISSTVRT